MTIDKISVGVGPYSDGSGFQFELKIASDTKVSIIQNSDHVILSRDEWREVRDAVDKMYDAMDDLVRKVA